MTPEKLRSHLLEELLPLWNAHGVDRKWGGFIGRLTPSLRPTPDASKRLVVQARQIWVFSRAWLEGAPEWALEAAQRGVEFLRAGFWDPSAGGWYLTTTREGEPLDRRKDTYAHAFALLALAQYARADPRGDAAALADETFALLERHLADPERGGFFEGASEDWTPVAGPRRQNPHMHLFEALLALDESTGDARYRRAAESLLGLLRERFVDPERGFLREYFTESWQPHPGAEGRVVEPGHHFEWVWLLHRYAQRASDPSALQDADGLYRFALRHGVDSEYGGVYDQIDPAGAIARSGKRLWPQTEYLKALSARVEVERDPDALARLRAMLELCFSRYLEPEHRGWREQSTREGAITSELMNATSVYHVWGALAETARVLEAAPGPD